ncbi:hypothetical protein [Sphingopyxis sp. C-1]|uniref:hypothetical protein n=1 Tax=Sphingopyxis sp. C-1 TaxID=262667 RepID=UPI000780C4F6|nr:hypothetical protein [Sphingopyxis sp. C-1]
MSIKPPADPKKTSAAHIKIRPVSAATKSETDAMFSRLSTLLRNIAPGINKNDQVTALIAACIGEGVVTGKKIIGLVSYFGFNPIHVAKMLEHGIGNDPTSGHWHRNHDSSFSLFE